MSLHEDCNEGPCPQKDVCWEPVYSFKKDYVTIPEYVPFEVESEIQKKLWHQEVEMRQYEEEYVTVKWTPTYEKNTRMVQRPCVVWKSHTETIPVKSWECEKINTQHEQEHCQCQWVEKSKPIEYEKDLREESLCFKKPKQPCFAYKNEDEIRSSYSDLRYQNRCLRN